MSAPLSPVQSGPPTPVASLAYSPAVTKFKRDNQLLGVAHSSSGLFTPLEGSGSSSPSPSDTATPEERPCVEVGAEMPVADRDRRHQEGQTNFIVASPASGSPDIQDVGSNPIPEDGNWEEVPRLSMPPAEIMDHVEETFTAVPATRVFFQPAQPSENVEGSDARSEAEPNDGVRDDDVLPAIVADAPRKEKRPRDDVRGLHNPKSLVHPPGDTVKDPPEVTETNDPFKFMGNNSTVAPGAVADDNDVSSISSSSPDEKTPR